LQIIRVTLGQRKFAGKLSIDASKYQTNMWIKWA